MILMKDREIFPLTKDNIDKVHIYPFDIAFLFYVEGGGMGSPGLITFVLENGEVYSGNYLYDGIEQEKFYKFFPDIRDDIYNLGENWCHIDLGMKNHIVVRREYFDVYKKELLLVSKDYKLPQQGILKNWLEVALNILMKYHS